MPARYYGYKKPSTANAKPATTPPIVTTGQWAPGALSNLPTTQGVTQSVADKNVTHFTDLGGGKTGSLVDQPVTDLNQQTPAFAAKAQQALAQEALSQQQVMPQGASGAQAPAASLLAPNTANPFAPNFSGTPPQTGFEQTAGAEGMMSQDMNAPYGYMPVRDAQGNITGYRPTTQNESGSASAITADDLLAVMPNGSFGVGIVDDWVLGSLKRTAAGVITKEALSKGGAKATVTSKGFIARLMVDIAWNIKNRPLKTLLLGGGAAGFAGFAGFFVHELIGTYPFSDFETNKAVSTVNYAFDNAAKHNDIRGMKAAIVVHKELTIPTVKSLSQKLPHGNTIKAETDLSKALDFQMSLNEKYVQDMEGSGLMSMADGSNITPQDTANFWNQYHTQLDQEEIETARIKNEEFNASRLLGEEQVLAARARANTSERAADRKAAEDLAAFWLDYQTKLAAMEEESMQKQAKFWLEYRKMVLKIQEETGRSRLGFGLFR